jgi:hypothetical protein
VYISPNHPNPPRRPEPPREEGRRLATFARTPRPGDGKPPQELRVSLEHFQGSPYVALKVWEQSSDGSWWPVKGKTISVRMGEVDELAEALGGVKALVESHGPSTRAAQPGDRSTPSGTDRGDEVRYIPPRNARPQPRDPNTPGPGYPTPTSSDQPFDEFA